MILDRVRRVTRDGRWIPEIDGLRFLAIAGVLIFHLGGELQARSGRFIAIEPRYTRMFNTLGNGDRGVRLFFVISGMILAMPFARQWLAGGKRVSLRKYYLRRVTRLEPPYLLSVALFLLLLAVYTRGAIAGLVPHALASSVYLHNVIFGTVSPVNAVSWSLEIEIQFYVLAPLAMQLLRVPRKVLRRGVLCVLIAAAGWVQLPFTHDARVTLSLLFYVQYFLAGLLVADVFVLELPTMRSSWWWDGLGAIGLGCMFGLNRDFAAAHAILPFSMALLIVSVMRSHALRWVFKQPWIAVTGGMCYSIYLMHFPLIAVFFKVTRRLISTRLDFLGNFLVQCVVTLLPVLLLCVVFYLLVERPCMDPDWPSKLWERVTGRRSKEAEMLDSAGIAE